MSTQPRTKRSPRSLILLGALTLSVAHCGALLGIEELEPATDSSHSEGGSAGTAMVGGATSGGDTATGGTVPGDAGMTGVGTGGNGGQGGSAEVGGEGGAAGGEGGSAGQGGETVSGRVLDRLRLPFAGLKVRVGSSVTVSAEDGTFTLENVVAPYDISVVDPNGLGYLFRSVTRLDPTLPVYGRALPLARELSGTLTGNAIPLASNESVRLMFDGDVGATYRKIVLANGSTYSFHEHRWERDSPTTVTLRALGVRTTSGNPEYFGFWTLSANVTASIAATTLATLNVDEATLTLGTISGSFNNPDSVPARKRCIVRFNDGTGSIPVIDDTSAGTTFSYEVPVLPDSTYSCAIGTISGYEPIAIDHRSGILTGDPALDLTLPSTPTLTAPVDGAGQVKTGTTFSWSGGAGGVYQVAIGVPGTDIVVFTTETSITLPSFAQDGLPLPKDADGLWHVNTLAPYDSIDEALGDEPLLDAWENELIAAPERDGTFARSVQRFLVTAP